MTARPDLIISSQDAERLERLLETLPAAVFPGKQALEQELARASIVAPPDVPPDEVTMNSVVRFSVDAGTAELTMQLVYPQDSGKSADRISVLAPAGSALLGLRENDEIEWPGHGRVPLRVRISKVVHQPERAGDFRS